MARLEFEENGYLGDKTFVHVVLSERNLLTLLSKLYTDGSQATILNTDTPPGYVLALRAEKDDKHYSSVTRNGAPAGRMHPVTEKILQVLKDHEGDLHV